MTNVASKRCKWLLTLWSKPDCDMESNYWTWAADLYLLADGTYRVTMSQCPGAPGEEDWVASEQDGLLEESELFEFLCTSLAQWVEETLTEAEWREVATLVQQTDGALGAGFEVAIEDEFNPREFEELVGPPEPLTPIERCITDARWDSPSFGGGGAMWAAIAFKSRMRRAVEVYASRHLASNGAPPQGPHRVQLTYGPLEGVDFHCPVSRSDTGSVDQIVSF